METNKDCQECFARIIEMVLGETIVMGLDAREIMKRQIRLEQWLHMKRKEIADEKQTTKE